MLNPQELTEAVTDYLQDNETEYAIMINGKWGCGKTYFWNNSIVPKLKEKSIKNISVSLYGVKNIDEIEQKILYKLLNLSTNYNLKKLDTSSKFEKIIWKLSNSNLFSLRCFIANRYDSENFNKWYLDEKPNLQKLKNLLDKHINEKNNNPQSLQCCLVAELRDKIDEVIKKIK